ncbi:Tripeptidyl-peptidase SED1 [Xylariomycetidae sp. FL2044]|nr:Tripeptidyl-peptidase SED1 [Xylariomycetidae sp. FL2044]
MRILLATQDLERAESYLARVSDPESPDYTKYWSAKQVAQTFAPAAEAVEEVIGWLEESGILEERSTHYGCDNYSVPEAIRHHIDLISPTVEWGNHRQDAAVWTRPPSSRAPRTSEGKGDPIARRDATLPQVDCAKLTTPACLRELYDIPVRSTSHPNNSLGTVTFYSGAYVPGDLDVFFAKFQPELVGRRPDFQSVDGGVNRADDEGHVTFGHSGEANLDLSYAMALAAPLNVTTYHVGDPVRGGFFNHLLAAFDATYCESMDPKYDAKYPGHVPDTSTPAPPPPPPRGGDYEGLDCGTHRPPRVLSISYGGGEGQYSPAYERRQCLEFLKLGLLGVTVVVSTGDHGVRRKPLAGPCRDSDERFHVSFPASCPYVLSVGGTQLLPAANGSVGMMDHHREVAFDTSNSTSTSPSTSGEDDDDAITAAGAAAALSSAGGFSDRFGTPAYQREAVAAYLARERAHLSTFAYRFNATGRGYPDVAAAAGAYVIAVNGTLTSIYGTSAAAPTVAALLALVNDERLRAGKGTLGFVNPALYYYAHAHYAHYAHDDDGAAAASPFVDDVVDGCNYDCRMQGFRAAEGWDPVTGLGTLNYRRMLEVFMQMP